MMMMNICSPRSIGGPQLLEYSTLKLAKQSVFWSLQAKNKFIYK